VAQTMYGSGTPAFTAKLRSPWPSSTQSWPDSSRRTLCGLPASRTRLVCHFRATGSTSRCCVQCRHPSLRRLRREAHGAD